MTGCDHEPARFLCRPTHRALVVIGSGVAVGLGLDLVGLPASGHPTVSVDSEDHFAVALSVIGACAGMAVVHLRWRPFLGLVRHIVAVVSRAGHVTG